MRALVSGLSASLLVLGGCATQPHASPQEPMGAPENVTLDSLPEAALPHCTSGTPMDLYPKGARAKGVQGRELIEFDIDPSGRVKDARVVTSEPAGVFGEAVLPYVHTYRCPGAPGEQKYRLSFVFVTFPCPHAAPCQVPKAYPTMNSPIIVTEGVRPTTRAEFEEILKQSMSP